MYKIAVIPGDGTGPEVVAEGLKVLKAVSEKFKFKYQLEYYGFEDKRDMTGLCSPRIETDGCDLSGCDWPSRGKAWNTGEGDFTEDSVSTGSIYQPETCQTLPGSGNPTERQES